MLELLSHVAALVLGSAVLSLLLKPGRGEIRFSLPLLNIILVTLVGGILSRWFGWVSTGIVLGAYGLYCVIGGWMTRQWERGS